MEKIRVIEIINALQSRAGAEVFFVDLCVQLSKRDDVELNVMILYGDIHKSFIDLFSKHEIKYWTLNKKKHFDLKASKLLRKKIKEIKPDVINTHLSVLFTYFFAFGFRKTKWKLIHTVHSIAVKEATIIDRFLRPIYIKKHILSFIGISDLITESVKKIHKNCVINTVYNGINMDVNIPQKTKNYTFICVARFTPLKNHIFLLDAFEDFNKKHPESTLLCVGGGEDYDKIMTYKNGLISKDKITISKPVDHIYDLLSRSRIFILTSIYEGNPISILEALHAGLPIISSKVGGIPDVVLDNKNGLLFESGNKKQLLYQMEKMYVEETLFNNIAKENILYSQKFNILNTSEKYLDVFKRSLKNSVSSHMGKINDR